MKCPNCGFENDDLSGFCMGCGQPVPVGKQKKALGNLNKNKKRRRIILIVLLAVIVGGGLFLGREYIVEFFLRTFSSPEDYTRHVIRKNFSGDKVAELYENYFFTHVETPRDTSVSGDIKLDLTTRAISDIEDESYSKDLDYLDDIVVEYEFDRREELYGSLFNLRMDDRDIAQVDAIYDADVKKAYLRIPEINGDYAGIDLSCFYNAGQMDLVDEALAGSGRATEKLPAPATVKKEWDRYLEAIIAPIDEVDMEKENLKIEGVKQNLYAITIDFDDELAADMLVSLCDASEEDEELQKLVIDMAEAFGMEELDNDKAADRIKDVTDKLRKAAEDIDFRDTDIEICMYVNAKGVIQATRLSFDIDMYGTDMKEEILIGYTKSWTNIGMTLSSTTDFGYGRSVNKIAGRGELGFSGLDATLTMDVGMQSVDLDIEDLDVFALRKGRVKGSLSGELISEIFNANNFRLDVDMDKKGGMAKLMLKDGKKDYIGIDFTISHGKAPASFKVPTSEVSDISDLSSLKDYVSDCDFDSVIDNLKKAGVNGGALDTAEDALDMIKQIAQNGVFPQIYYWGLSGHLRKYIDKSRIASDTQTADTIHTAFITCLYDPDVIYAADYTNAYRMLQQGFYLNEHSPSENTMLSAVAEIIGVEDFSELMDDLKSGGCTGIYVVSPASNTVYVTLEGTDDGYGSEISVTY